MNSNYTRAILGILLTNILLIPILLFMLAYGQFSGAAFAVCAVALAVVNIGYFVSITLRGSTER
jgi:hypothetical protein